MGGIGYCQQEWEYVLERPISKALKVIIGSDKEATIGINTEIPLLLLLIGLNVPDDRLVE